MERRRRLAAAFHQSVLMENCVSEARELGSLQQDLSLTGCTLSECCVLLHTGRNALCFRLPAAPAEWRQHSSARALLQ